MSDVRVRFAPSPTGYLHIGGVRTALYCWLWARKHGGTFILRIEDTDRERSTTESVNAVLDAMRWLELAWDEGPEVGGDYGPYFQSERLSLYRAEADKLVERGLAYRCICTKEELAEARKAQEAAGEKGFRYPGTCRDRGHGEDQRHVVRFRAPTTGTTGWDDLVRGRIEMPNDTQQDFVLVRTDGMPLYNFGCVVDDASMKVTLVARGDDHMINTPIQILLYHAMGLPVPLFAHLPMILAPSGEKLSKRHAAVSALEYRDMGYLPDGVLNYLARIGWSHGDQEIFTRQELIEKFDWANVGKTSGKYDAKKFAHVQAEHLRMLPDDEVARQTVPFLAQRGLAVPADDPRLRKAMPHIKPRATTLIDVAEAVDYFFRDEPVMEEKARNKFLRPEHAERLENLASMIRDVEPFDTPALEARVTGWLEDEGIKLKDVAQPARVALTGRTRSPGLFEVMEILGRDQTLARLGRASRVARGA